jgi:hypothetical protein
MKYSFTLDKPQTVKSIKVVFNNSTDFFDIAACPFTLCRGFFTPKIGPVPPKL